jgi:signal transduction histidine kinase
MSEDAAFRVVVAQVTHDLANLLTCILACATHASSQATTRSRDLDAIREAAVLACDLLATLRGQDAGQETNSRVPDVLRTCATLLARVGAVRGVSIAVDIEGEPTVALPAYQLQEVVLNLGLNAIEAIVAGGKIDVVVRETDDHVTLTVVDDGPGLPIDRQAGDSSKLGHVGVGLGAVYSIVDRVGGSVEISSAATGTMIAVRLPRA